MLWTNIVFLYSLSKFTKLTPFHHLKETIKRFLQFIVSTTATPLMQEGLDLDDTDLWLHPDFIQASVEYVGGIEATALSLKVLQHRTGHSSYRSPCYFFPVTENYQPFHVI